MKIFPPFRAASPNNISQGFVPLRADGYSHEANDIAGSYGTWLVAPFDCVVERIVQAGSYGNKVISDTATQEVQYGCGISMISTKDPSYRVVYWHCLPEFPVKVGEVVLAGQPVAQMGNLGMVSMGGIPVSVQEREKEYAESTPTNFPKKGVHVHLILAINSVPVDPSQYIDWTQVITFDLLTAIKNTLQSISNFIFKQ